MSMRMHEITDAKRKLQRAAWVMQLKEEGSDEWVVARAEFNCAFNYLYKSGCNAAGLIAIANVYIRAQRRNNEVTK